VALPLQANLLPQPQLKLSLLHQQMTATQMQLSVKKEKKPVVISRRVNVKRVVKWIVMLKKHNVQPQIQATAVN
jgi:hypothetical protein